MNKLTIALIILTMLSCGMPVVSVTIDTTTQSEAGYFRRHYWEPIRHVRVVEGDKWRMP